MMTDCSTPLRKLLSAPFVTLALSLFAFGIGFWSHDAEQLASPSDMTQSAPAAIHRDIDETRHSLRPIDPILDLVTQTPQQALIQASDEKIELSTEMMAALVAHWLTRSPDEPLRFLQENTSLSETVRQQFYIALLPTIVRDSPEEGIQLVKNLKNTDKMLNALVQEWAKIAPEEAIDYTTQVQEREVREGQTLIVYKVWLQKDPDRAADWLLTIEDKAIQYLLLRRSNWRRVKASTLIQVFTECEHPREIASELAQKLGDNHAPQVVELLQTVPLDGYILSAYGRIPIRDQQTFQSILDTVESKDRDQILSRLLYSWIKHDSHSAWAWIQTQQDSSNYQKLVERYAFGAPEAAETLLPMLSNMENATKVTNTLFSKIGRYQPDPVQWAKDNLNDEQRGQALLNSFSYLVRQEPDKLIELLHELPEGSKKDSLIKKHIEDMVRYAPLDTLEFIHQRPPSKLRETQANQALENLIWIDPYSASEYVNQSEWINDATRAQLQLTFAQQLSRTDKPAAIRLLQQLPETNGRNQQLGEFLEDLSVRGNLQLVRNTIDSLSAGTNKEHALLQVLKVFARSDLHSTYDWIKYEQNDDFQSRALRTLSGEWVRRDTHAAEQWINSLPKGNGRDSAIKVLIAHERNNKSHQSAFNWALTIDNENQRNNELRQTLKQWKDSDAYAASRSINYSSRLSLAEKSELLQLIEPEN